LAVAGLSLLFVGCATDGQPNRYSAQVQAIESDAVVKGSVFELLGELKKIDAEVQRLNNEAQRDYFNALSKTESGSVEVDDNGRIKKVVFPNYNVLLGSVTGRNPQSQQVSNDLEKSLFAMVMRPVQVPRVEPHVFMQFLGGIGNGFVELARVMAPITGQWLMNRDSINGQVSMNESNNHRMIEQFLAQAGVDIAEIEADERTMANMYAAFETYGQAMTELGQSGFSALEGNNTEWARAIAQMDTQDSQAMAAIFQSWAEFYRNNTYIEVNNTESSSSSSSHYETFEPWVAPTP